MIMIDLPAPTISPRAIPKSLRDIPAYVLNTSGAPLPNANKVTAMINRLTNRALSIRIDRLNHVAGYLVNPLDRGRRNLLAYQRRDLVKTFLDLAN